MSKEFSNSFDSPVNKFEQMLQTNSTLFFDVQEFENIIHHYIDSGERIAAPPDENDGRWTERAIPLELQSDGLPGGGWSY